MTDFLNIALPVMGAIVFVGAGFVIADLFRNCVNNVLKLF